ncbi:MAG: Asp-tRNA(Asn)/Glu-tRNA(Gln) amidotransferase subunit GatA [Ferruginibacter sp.]|nr:Asp-tRNA(Asn)/Glu-tRNA(Gln) amidotransferase subunit GatA [Ferruginibacter sp.]
MFSFVNIEQYHKDLKQGKTSSKLAVEFYLKNIKNHNQLNAFVEIYADEAIQKATLLDEKIKSGEPIKKLHGVVIALKDVICYANHKVTAASAILKDYTSSYSASAVQYLLDEDAIIIGTCNCDEFAMGSTNENSYYGKVFNALDHTKVPGGSSGGSAVAVQADMCMLSLGSDTGGSVRQPADFCGVIGLKPSYGTISRYGLIAYASSFDQIGIFGKHLQDAALLLEVMAKPDAFDSTMNMDRTKLSLYNMPYDSNKKYTIAYFKEMLEHPSLDTEISDSIKETAAILKADGHTINAVEFDLLDYIVPAYYVLTTAEASSNLSRYDGIRYGHRSNIEIGNLTDFYLNNRSEGFGKEVKRRIMLGAFVLSSGYYDAYYSKAQQVRKKLVEKVNRIFEEYDAIILPNSPTTAFSIGQKDKDPIATYLSDIFTVFANLTGLPAISLPIYKHSNGMPFGLQVITKKYDEKGLIQLSALMMDKKKNAVTI